MFHPLAMIDPGAAAGGAIVLLSVIVSVAAGIVHFFLRPYWLVCLGSGLTLFLPVFFAWVCLDVLDPDSGDRMYSSMRLLPWAFVFPFVGATYTGLPAVIFRSLRA